MEAKGTSMEVSGKERMKRGWRIGRNCMEAKGASMEVSGKERVKRGWRIGRNRRIEQ